MKILRPLAVIDLETTGTWVEKDRIIEIGIIKSLPDGTCRTFLKRIHPGMPIPPAVTKITGITDADVRQAPPFKNVAGAVMEFIGDADLGGFNVERFDLPLLKRELFEAGFKFEWRSRKIFDAQKIYHCHEKRDLKAAYRFYCHKDLTNAHSALGDVEAALEILAAQVGQYGGGKETVDVLEAFDYENRNDPFDEQGKFCWWNGELYPSFGKYRERLGLKQIARQDPDYLRWVLGQDFDEDVKRLVRDALNGEFPVKGPAKRL